MKRPFDARRYRDLGSRMVDARAGGCLLKFWLLSIIPLFVSLYRVILLSVWTSITVVAAILIAVCAWVLIPRLRRAAGRARVKAEADQYADSFMRANFSTNSSANPDEAAGEFLSRSVGLAEELSGQAVSRQQAVLRRLRDTGSRAVFATPLLVMLFVKLNDRSLREEIEQSLRVIDANYLQNSALRKYDYGPDGKIRPCGGRAPSERAETLRDLMEAALRART
jgi:hypothetical protein